MPGVHRDFSAERAGDPVNPEGLRIGGGLGLGREEAAGGDLAVMDPGQLGIHLQLKLPVARLGDGAGNRVGQRAQPIVRKGGFLGWIQQNHAGASFRALKKK